MSVAIQKEFQRRGIVEGFFGPPWSMSHRAGIFKFGAARGMNTYLYAPKDDPYHREHWTKPYPAAQWRSLLRLIRHAQQYGIDFVYGFHPGKGLCFSQDNAVTTLLKKAARFYDAGVRTFAILFDDIPSHLEHKRDRLQFKHSLAHAEAIWMEKILMRQPASWNKVEWWICPSYYTPDPLLARTYGAFEPQFLETLAYYLPENIACFWTGSRVVPQTITLAHIQRISNRLKHPLLLWDNYPVNDLSMSNELHIGPLQGRDPRLPRVVYGYLNNPLIQEQLSFIPLATCFDYAVNPAGYDPEKSWTTIVEECFGSRAVTHWRSIREFCSKRKGHKGTRRSLRLPPKKARRLRAAAAYLRGQTRLKWGREIKPWREMIENALD